MSLSKPIRIAVDAMGGDLGPQLTIAASLEFQSCSPNLQLILVGDQEIIRANLPANQKKNLEILHAPQSVEMAEKPSTALRHKRESSMWKAIELVKNDRADACISAGNTGALMAMGRSQLGTMEGIERPAICKAVPTAKGKSYLLDLGANIDCNADQLCEFALLGAALAKLDGRQNPKIALLNIGREEDKGPQAVREASERLQGESKFIYVGFIEGDAIYRGDVDVVVCDGHAGNIALKVSEGLVRFLTNDLAAWFGQRFWRAIVGKVMKPFLACWWFRFDPDRYNGAMLLGLNGIVIKSHGNASLAAFKAALSVAEEQIRGNQTHQIEMMIK